MAKLQATEASNASTPNETTSTVENKHVTVFNNIKEDKDDKLSNLEDVLSEFKLYGRYHLQFLSMISFLIIINAGYTLHYTFSAEDVDYRCKYTDCTLPDIHKLEQNSTLDYKCQNYGLSETNGTCTADNFDSSNFTRCSEWVYEDPKSFVGEFNLGCEDWKRTLVGTMHSTGFMFGLLIIGPLSDKFGRKKIIIFSTLFSAVIGVTKSMVTYYWLFIFLETFEAVLGDNYSTSYTMVAEMMTTKKRPVIVLLFSFSDTAGTLWMALLAYLTSTWRILLVSIYAPSFFFILYAFTLDESPRWLLIKGKKEEAKNVMKKAAKINGITIDESKLKNMKCDVTSEVNLREAISITFSSRKLVIRLLLCFCIWFSVAFNTFTLIIHSVSLEGNKYINFGITSISDLVGGVILLCLLTKFKRKGPLIVAFSVIGACSIAQSFTPTDFKLLSKFFYFSATTCTAITFKMSYLYTTELFPTYTRNTMLALCSAFGTIGSILAPLTPLLLNYWSSFPTFLVGVSALATALIVSFMPDTSEDVLPDNVKQAETIGMKEKTIYAL